jgi:predicted kinase
MNKQKIILTVGNVASGKSTWAKKMIDDNPGMYKRTNKDLIRDLLDNGKWSKSNEKFVLKIRDDIIIKALEDGYSVIIDDTNLEDSHLNRMKEIAEDFKLKGKIVEVEIKDFRDVPLDICIARDKARPNPVGEKVIRDFYNRYLKPEFKPIEYNPELPNACIFDLDGTLAIKGDRDIYDESKIYLDIVNKPVLEILKGLNSNTTIIFCSGRTDSCLSQTSEWLLNNVISKLPNYPNVKWDLLMRKTGDKRGDEIVKKEIYDNEIKGKWNVKFIVDDRPKVVRMWRSLGIFVFEVNQSDEEF